MPGAKKKGGKGKKSTAADAAAAAAHAAFASPDTAVLDAVEVEATRAATAQAAVDRKAARTCCTGDHPQYHETGPEATRWDSASMTETYQNAEAIRAALAESHPHLLEP
jgi:hypothetical protein